MSVHCLILAAVASVVLAISLAASPVTEEQTASVQDDERVEPEAQAGTHQKHEAVVLASQEAVGAHVAAVDLRLVVGFSS